MSHDMNEFANVPIGNVLKMIVFLYYLNDEWIFVVLSCN